VKKAGVSPAPATPGAASVQGSAAHATSLSRGTATVSPAPAGTAESSAAAGHLTAGARWEGNARRAGGAFDPTGAFRPVGAHNPAVAHNPAGAHHATGAHNSAGAHNGTGENEFAGADEQLTTTASGEAASDEAVIAPYLYMPGLARGQGNAAAIKAAKLSSKSALISLSTIQKTKRPWEAGFVAGGGLSRLNRVNLSSNRNQALSASLYNIANGPTSSGKNYVSDVRPDVSFMAGIYLQKGLSSRWTLNLGMNLHYYSTRITIGQPVSTYVPVSASLIASSLAPSAQSATAYIAGDKQNFTNHYYFLELPVNIQYQLNKSRLLPLFVEGGFSLARLMGSDALFYNSHSGVYYKDPAVLQKTQLNVSSAVMIGLPFHGIRIQAGPQVQYGLTPLINNHSQGDQHFLYTGIKVVIVPGRK
jgi:hypothetical protein